VGVYDLIVKLGVISRDGWRYGHDRNYDPRPKLRSKTESPVQTVDENLHENWFAQY